VALVEHQRDRVAGARPAHPGELGLGDALAGPQRHANAVVGLAMRALAPNAMVFDVPSVTWAIAHPDGQFGSQGVTAAPAGPAAATALTSAIARATSPRRALFVLYVMSFL
jgi:hypothetical protein